MKQFRRDGYWVSFQRLRARKWANRTGSGLRAGFGVVMGGKAPKRLLNP